MVILATQQNELYVYDFELNIIEPFDLCKTIEEDLGFVYDPDKMKSESILGEVTREWSVVADPLKNPILDLSYNNIEKKIYVAGVNLLKSYEMAGCQMKF